MSRLLFYVNEKEIIDENIEPEWTLLWYLRNKLRLTGSKLGCGEGGCGACTVLISRCVNSESNEIEYRTVNACLTPICSIDGCHVLTVEGVGSVNKSNLHSIQIRLGELSGSQCGYCTPGMIMSLYAILSNDKEMFSSLKDIEDSLDGNLCRCTGYRPILDTAKTFARDFSEIYCEKSKSSTTFDKCQSYVEQNSLGFDRIAFPDRLRNYVRQSIHIEGKSFDWYRPISLDELLRLRHQFPGNESKLIFGNTTVHLERISCRRLISLIDIKQLQNIEQTNDSLIIGAGVTFARLKTNLNTSTNDFSRALLDQLKHFASTQIRNVASIGGNIIAASPVSDINPILIAAHAQVELHRFDCDQPRLISINEFFLENHRVAIEENEILVGIHLNLPKSTNRYFLRSYKQARRRDDSRGIVSAAFQLQLDEQEKISSVCFAFSGMSSKTITTSNTQRKIIGLRWNKQTFDQICQLIIEELPLNNRSPGGQIQFRYSLIQSFLFKFYSFVCQQLKSTNTLSIESFDRPVSHAQQTVVGTSLPHRSAFLHTTGEAIFIDDIPSLENTLHAKFVLSTKANAKIVKIDIEKASNVVGFVSFVSCDDVPGTNKPNGSLPDEEIFASSIVLAVGTIIGIVVCENEQAAQLACELVEIQYEQLPTKNIFSIDDAIEQQSFFGDEILLNQGNVDEIFSNAEHFVEDTIYIGGQEHFYMETNACIVIPSNDDKEIRIYTGCQSLSTLQELTAQVLDRDVSQVICQTKRVGGAFGGKESRTIPLCIATAVAAVKTGRPVRLNVDRQTDISITGHRHPFKVKYRIAFNQQGQFLALDISMWNNAGCTLDASRAVMELAMLHMGNVYQFPHMRIRGWVCKTHLPSNTAFRGFGGPQAILACETIVEHVACYLKCDPLTIRMKNLFKEGDRTHYGQTLECWNIPRIVDELIQSSQFKQRQIQMKQFNELNPYRKRGICLIPNKFGIGFVVNFLNQAGALVHIYKDGSVVLCHSAVEIGQGIHTKMIFIASEILRCNVDRIRISETATDKSHNMSPTGGSISSDLNGMAIQDACQQLRQRLDSIEKCSNSDLSWEDLIQQAYYQRIDLCARGFYKTPNMFDMDLTQNRATYNYFTQGAAVSEVELDVLTGDWHLIRVDILMDVGKSLNPQIDIGQIEGGFMQGVGLYTMEELIWGDDKQFQWIQKGYLYTQNPDTYKIPSFSDVPIDFRVSLLADSANPRAVFSSKGIGEPPLLLGTSVFFALKQACMAYRQQQQQHSNQYLTLYSPATVERLRLACADEFTRRACSNNVDYLTFQPNGSF